MCDGTIDRRSDRVTTWRDDEGDNAMTGLRMRLWNDGAVAYQDHSWLFQRIFPSSPSPFWTPSAGAICTGERPFSSALQTHRITCRLYNTPCAAYVDVSAPLRVCVSVRACMYV